MDEDGKKPLTSTKFVFCCNGRARTPRQAGRALPAMRGPLGADRHGARPHGPGARGRAARGGALRDPGRRRRRHHLCRRHHRRMGSNSTTRAGNSSRESRSTNAAIGVAGRSTVEALGRHHRPYARRDAREPRTCASRSAADAVVVAPLSIRDVDDPVEFVKRDIGAVFERARQAAARSSSTTTRISPRPARRRICIRATSSR